MIQVNGEEKRLELNDSILIPPNTRCVLSVCLRCNVYCLSYISNLLIGSILFLVTAFCGNRNTDGKFCSNANCVEFLTKHNSKVYYHLTKYFVAAFALYQFHEYRIRKL